MPRDDNSRLVRCQRKYPVEALEGWSPHRSSAPPPCERDQRPLPLSSPLLHTRKRVSSRLQREGRPQLTRLIRWSPGGVGKEFPVHSAELMHRYETASLGTRRPRGTRRLPLQTWRPGITLAERQHYS